MKILKVALSLKLENPQIGIVAASTLLQGGNDPRRHPFSIEKVAEGVMVENDQVGVFIPNSNIREITYTKETPSKGKK
jgi:hypothetical protein